MKHLLVNPHCDCKHNIQWIADNIGTCRINREYKERHEPTFHGVSISVLFIGSDDWSEFAANDEGWMYVSDWDAKHLPKIPIVDGIKEVEDHVLRIKIELARED